MQNDYQTELNSFHVTLRTFFKFYIAIAGEASKNLKDHDASLLLQKFFLHSLSLFELGSNSHMIAPNTNKPFSILDPISMNSLLRSQLETYCCFNYVFVEPVGKENQFLRYAFWKHAGLRTRGESPARMKKHKIKKSKERQEIHEFELKINNTKKIKNLSNTQKKQLLRFQENNTWQILFQQSKIKKIDWAGMLMRSGMKKSLFGNQYNSLSWNSHPTYISLVQLSRMYIEGYDKSNAATLYRVSTILIYAIILDSCAYFDGARKVFHALPTASRNDIIACNRAFRYKSKIDRIIRKLEDKN